MALIYYYFQDLFIATQGFNNLMAANNLKAQQYKQTFLIQADIFNISRYCQYKQIFLI